MIKLRISRQYNDIIIRTVRHTTSVLVCGANNNNNIFFNCRHGKGEGNTVCFALLNEVK